MVFKAIQEFRATVGRYLWQPDERELPLRTTAKLRHRNEGISMENYLLAQEQLQGMPRKDLLGDFPDNHGR